MKKTLYILTGVAAFSNFTVTSSFADECERSFELCVGQFERTFMAAKLEPAPTTICAQCHSSCQTSLNKCVKEQNWRLEGLTHTLVMGCNQACQKTAPAK